MKQSKQENLFYLIAWGVLFAAPLIGVYVHTVNDADIVFDWMEVLNAWRRLVPFFLLFLIHNFLLAPLFVHYHKYVTYICLAAAIIVAFLFITGNHDMIAIMTITMMFCANVAVKGYIRSCNDSKCLADLERGNLKQQMENLCYQIHAQFFMNTFNYIYALVDIDPEKAKEAIGELSKTLRYVLYEGNKQYVHLYNELDFTRHYVKLMQLRYTDKVKITLDLPLVPNRQIPPLILIPFIENAFRQCISYQRESFVEIKIVIEDDKLNFTCRNSKGDRPTEEKEGMNIDDVRKRLSLLYDQYYSLRIENAPEFYSVELVIPLK